MIGDIMNITRLRMASDGEGVSTLITFFGCPLNCKYCLNDYCHENARLSYRETERGAYTPDALYQKLLVDDLYFRMTGGGIVFGGGEPLLQAQFIHELCMLCDAAWKKRIETSLYSEWGSIQLLLRDIDEWIIDIKDINPAKYERYTGKKNRIVIANLKKLLQEVPCDNVRVRVPHIEGINNDEDVARSIAFLKRMGVSNIDEFTYIKTKTRLH